MAPCDTGRLCRSKPVCARHEPGAAAVGRVVRAVGARGAARWRTAAERPGRSFHAERVRSGAVKWAFRIAQRPRAQSPHVDAGAPAVTGLVCTQGAPEPEAVRRGRWLLGSPAKTYGHPFTLLTLSELYGHRWPHAARSRGCGPTGRIPGIWAWLRPPWCPSGPYNALQGSYDGLPLALSGPAVSG